MYNCFATKGLDQCRFEPSLLGMAYAMRNLVGLTHVLRLYVMTISALVSFEGGQGDILKYSVSGDQIERQQ